MGIIAFRTAALLLLILGGLSACSVLRLHRYLALRRTASVGTRIFYSPPQAGYVALKDCCLCQNRYFGQFQAQYDTSTVNLVKLARRRMRAQHRRGPGRRVRMQMARQHNSPTYWVTPLFRPPGSCEGLYSWWNFDARYPAHGPLFRYGRVLPESLLIVYHDTVTLIGYDSVANQRRIDRLLRTELRPGLEQFQREFKIGHLYRRID